MKKLLLISLLVVSMVVSFNVNACQLFVNAVYLGAKSLTYADTVIEKSRIQNKVTSGIDYFNKVAKIEICTVKDINGQVVVSEINHDEIANLLLPVGTPLKEKVELIKDDVNFWSRFEPSPPLIYSQVEPSIREIGLKRANTLCTLLLGGYNQALLKHINETLFSITTDESKITLIFTDCLSIHTPVLPNTESNLIDKVNEFLKIDGEYIFDTLEVRPCASFRTGDVPPEKCINFLKFRRLGIIVFLEKADELLLAHELGHYFGLSHLGDLETSGCIDFDKYRSLVYDSAPIYKPNAVEKITGKKMATLILEGEKSWPNLPNKCRGVTNNWENFPKVPINNIMNYDGFDKQKFTKDKLSFTKGQLNVIKYSACIFENKPTCVIDWL